MIRTHPSFSFSFLQIYEAVGFVQQRFLIYCTKSEYTIHSYSFLKGLIYFEFSQIYTLRYHDAQIKRLASMGTSISTDWTPPWAWSMQPSSRVSTSEYLSYPNLIKSWKDRPDRFKWTCRGTGTFLWGKPKASQLQLYVWTFLILPFFYWNSKKKITLIRNFFQKACAEQVA